MSIDIAVFAKAPVPGAAKTRLIPRLGAQGAAALHGALVEHCLARAKQAALGDVTLWCAPDAAHPFFAHCALAHGVALAAQRSGDLGARMLGAFEAHAPLLLLGADCPSITAQDLRDCAQALHAGADAVFLPADDGGYGLVGARRALPSLFADMEWGVSSVMEETRKRLRAQGLTWREPRKIWDVDRAEDYERLVAEGVLGERWR
jgi:rSAM/selenodomain-associated transferase 1